MPRLITMVKVVAKVSSVLTTYLISRVISFNLHSNATTSPLSQIRDLELREVRQLVRGHIARQ